MDQNGDTLWTRNNYSNTNAAAYSIALTSGNGFILTGTREDTTGTGHAFLMETDATGDSLWIKEYPYWAASGGNMTIPNLDDGYLICGFMDRDTPVWNRKMGLIKTNNQGDTLWTRQYGTSSYEMGWAVCQSTSGGYLAAGYTTGFGATPGALYCLKTNLAGETEWETHFGNTGLDIAYDVANTSDLQYIASGITAEEGSETQESWLIKLGQNGDTLWTKKFGGYRKSFGYSVRQTNDEGFIMCGSTNASGTGIYDVFLVKTDPGGGVITSAPPVPAKDIRLNIFPNPSKGKFSIKLPLGSLRLSVSSANGSLLYEQVLKEKQGLFSLDITGSAPGIYLLRIYTANQVITEKVIVL